MKNHPPPAPGTRRAPAPVRRGDEDAASAKPETDYQRRTRALVQSTRWPLVDRLGFFVSGVLVLAIVRDVLRQIALAGGEALPRAGTALIVLMVGVPIAGLVVGLAADLLRRTPFYLPAQAAALLYAWHVLRPDVLWLAELWFG